MASTVHLGVVLQRRAFAHHVTAFNQDIRRGEIQALAPQRVNGKKADIGSFGGDGFNRLGRGFKNHTFQSNAKAIGQGLRQIDRHALGFAGLQVFACQDGIAQVDGGAQDTAGRQCLQGFR